MAGDGGERRGVVHPGEEVAGSGRGPAGGRVGDAAAPLEGEGQKGEGEREEGQQEEELRSEGRRRRRGGVRVEGRCACSERGVEVARHGGRREMMPSNLLAVCACITSI